MTHYLLLKKLAKKLIMQPSITPNDHNCQNIIAHYLKQLNFNLEFINFHDTCNLWAYHDNYNQINKKQSTLLFLGHTDVVDPGNINNWKYPPFSGLIKNDILYGRGASDMKGALSAMLIAVKSFIETYPNYHGRIAFLLTSDEEGSGKNGTVKVIQSLIKRQEHIDYCIVGEPSSQKKLGDVIKNGRRGSGTGKLTIFGLQGHVAYPHMIINPIHLSIPILLKLIHTKWDAKKSILFPPTSIQIIDIYTKSASNFTNNITPSELILKFNFRFNDQTSIFAIENNIKKILSMKQKQINYHINWETISEPYFSKPGKLSKIITNIIEKKQNITPKLETSGGTSDGRFITQTGAEIIELGALNHTIHKIDENIKLTDLYLLNFIYFKILEKVFIKNDNFNN